MILISKQKTEIILINIYYSHLSKKNHASLLKNTLINFSEDYQGKIGRYIRWQDAQSSLIGRLLLFKGIEDIKGLKCSDKKLRYTKYNKPYFEDQLIHFNISHSGDIVVCALSDQEIGIDIEFIRNIEIEDFKFIMTEKEWGKIVKSSNKNDSFFDYWTQKEAVIKANGNGLATDLKSFEISENITTVSNESFFLEEIKIDPKYKCYISQKEKVNLISVKKINLNNY